MKPATVITIPREETKEKEKVEFSATTVENSDTFPETAQHEHMARPQDHMSHQESDHEDNNK